MTNFIPIFPLNIVVYPGEKLNLHIFEPRYKQLVKECFELKKPFGIPTVVNNQMKNIGTTVLIQTIEVEHENGNLDIKTIGQDIFTVLEVLEEIPEKMYKGAIVHFPENQNVGIRSKMNKLLKELKYFHQILEVSKTYQKDERDLCTYDIAHHVGMSLEQEFEMLCLLREDQRQEYLERHLKKMIPTILELQNLKDRILMNGHFRKLSIDDN